MRDQETGTASSPVQSRGGPCTSAQHPHKDSVSERVALVGDGWEEEGGRESTFLNCSPITCTCMCKLHMVIIIDYCRPHSSQSMCKCTHKQCILMMKIGACVRL